MPNHRLREFAICIPLLSVRVRVFLLLAPRLGLQHLPQRLIFRPFFEELVVWPVTVAAHHYNPSVFGKVRQEETDEEVVREMIDSHGLLVAVWCEVGLVSRGDLYGGGANETRYGRKGTGRDAVDKGRCEGADVGEGLHLEGKVHDKVGLRGKEAWFDGGGRAAEEDEVRVGGGGGKAVGVE